jgi:HEPN domain-containing protein
MTEATLARPKLAVEHRRDLDRAVRRLVDELHPLAVYLFGSRARGDAHQDSDYDLMVVVPDDVVASGKHRPISHDRVGRMYANVFLSRESSFAWRRHAVGTLEYEVETDGVRLYPQAGIDLRDRLARTPVGGPMSAKVVREWLGRVDRDLVMARKGCEGPDAVPDQAAYHVQQAAEKLAKAALIANGIRPRKGHEISEFAKRLPKAFPDRERYLALARFSVYAWAHRYPWEGEGEPIAEPSVEEVLDWIAEVAALKSDLERRIETHAGAQGDRHD